MTHHDQLMLAFHECGCIGPHLWNVVSIKPGPQWDDEPTHWDRRRCRDCGFTVTELRMTCSNAVINFTRAIQVESMAASGEALDMLAAQRGFIRSQSPELETDHSLRNRMGQSHMGVDF